MAKHISIPCLGYTIEADWHEGASNKQILLTFVGYKSSKQSNLDFMAKLVEMTEVSALVVDFSGHGESPFVLEETTPAQYLFEAIKAYDWIKANYPDSIIHVMGTSNGGCMAAYLTRFRPVEKLVLRTPAIYEPDLFYTQHRFIDKILVREYRKNTIELQRHPLFLQPPIKQPATLLVVHSEDTSIPSETIEAYKATFNAQVYVAEGFVHAFRSPENPQEAMPAYYAMLTTWLKS